MKENTPAPAKRKRSFGAADFFIILLLILCLGGAAVRAFTGLGTPLRTGGEEYYVSYVISGAASELGEYLTDGVEFYTESGELFGTVTGDVVSTPARIYTENSRGEYVAGYSAGGETDIRGTFAVEGRQGERGFYCCGQYLYANMTLRVLTQGAAAEILITDITQAL